MPTRGHVLQDTWPRSLAPTLQQQTLVRVPLVRRKESAPSCYAQVHAGVHRHQEDDEPERHEAQVEDRQEEDEEEEQDDDDHEDEEEGQQQRCHDHHDHRPRKRTPNEVAPLFCLLRLPITVSSYCVRPLWSL